jgi:hypothetical protein
MYMHLAAAVETAEGRPRNRPCVVVAGGREPAQWEAYPFHQYLHTNGALPCCDFGGCWKSRILPLNDGDEKDNSLCSFPVKLETCRTIPKCLDMITADAVIQAIGRYLEFDKFVPAPKRRTGRNVRAMPLFGAGVNGTPSIPAPIHTDE